MSEIHKKSFSLGWLILIIFMALIDFALVIAYLLHGKNVALFSPKGQIAYEQYSLMVYVVAMLFGIAIPTLTVLFVTAWRYRESNTKAKHNPVASRSKLLVMSIWVVPTVFILILVSSMLPATQKLSPQKSIASDAEPLTVQVVAMRWKWLFIYPEQKIATVNFVQVPINTPVKFELTADEIPMSSFWIPNLGGQLYAMTGHVNPLNLLADTVGDYPGSSAEINGRGFAGMKFTARVSSAQDFDQWVKQIQQSPDKLNAASYEDLVAPSENNLAAFYSAYQSDLYDKVVMKYSGTTEGHGHSE